MSRSKQGPSGARTTRRQLFSAGAAGATVVASASLPGLVAGAGHEEDPGFFGEVTRKVDGSSVEIRLHETGELVVVRALPGAEIGRDGEASIPDFEPGERLTALGKRTKDVVSATAVFSVADAFDAVMVSRRTGARLDTSAGGLRLDGLSVAAEKVGERPDAKPASPNEVQPGSKLWVMTRRDPATKSAVIRRFAVYRD